MKAAFIRKTGSPEVIEYGDLPNPQPASDQYLIKVQATDVNPIDIYIRSGAIPANVSFPYIIGRDLAGVVLEAPSGKAKFKKGDRVWVTGQGVGKKPGTTAELIAVEEEWMHPTPPGVQDTEIVAVSLVGITAHLGLVREARLQRGETIFVSGGSGAVGLCVIQMAKILGARVITTAGSKSKADTCREFGADEVILYKQEEVITRLKSLAPEGVDVWWEALREPDFEKAIPLLRMRGRMVVMAGRDARPIFPVGAFYTKDCKILGFAMFNASAADQASAAADINQWMESGKLKAQIHAVMPFSKTAEAHRLQEESTIKKAAELRGKLVLTPG